MTQCIALLRGINVGRAKRIAMAELRELIEALGFSDVRTLLNSGNAVFQAARPMSPRSQRQSKQPLKPGLGLRCLSLCSLHSN